MYAHREQWRSSVRSAALAPYSRTPERQSVMRRSWDQWAAVAAPPDHAARGNVGCTLSSDWDGTSERWNNAVSVSCRSPFEKSQFLPDRNVTARPVDMTLRFRGTRPPRNGITAKRRVRARGSRAGAGLPGRAAQPLRPSFSPSIIRRPCEPAEPLRVVSRGRSCAAARSRPACQDQHRRWREAPRLSRCLEVRRARLRARRHRRPEVRPVQ